MSEPQTTAEFIKGWLFEHGLRPAALTDSDKLDLAYALGDAGFAMQAAFHVEEHLLTLQPGAAR